MRCLPGVSWLLLVHRNQEKFKRWWIFDVLWFFEIWKFHGLFSFCGLCSTSFVTGVERWICCDAYKRNDTSVYSVVVILLFRSYGTHNAVMHFMLTASYTLLFIHHHSASPHWLDFLPISRPLSSSDLLTHSLVLSAPFNCAGKLFCWWTTIMMISQHMQLKR